MLLEYPYPSLREALREVYDHTCRQGVAISTLTPAPETDAAAAGRLLCAAIEELLNLAGTTAWAEAIARARDGYDELQLLMAAAQVEFSWDHYYRAQELLSVLTPNGGPKGTAKAARDAVKDAMAAWIGACLDIQATVFIGAFIPTAAPLRCAVSSCKR